MEEKGWPQGQRWRRSVGLQKVRSPSALAPALRGVQGLQAVGSNSGCRSLSRCFGFGEPNR